MRFCNNPTFYILHLHSIRFALYAFKSCSAHQPPLIRMVSQKDVRTSPEEVLRLLKHLFCRLLPSMHPAACPLAGYKYCCLCCKNTTILYTIHRPLCNNIFFKPSVLSKFISTFVKLFASHCEWDIARYVAPYIME